MDTKPSCVVNQQYLLELVLKSKNMLKILIKERNLDIKINITSNPEFLKEGAAVEDCMRLERVVIGAEKEEVFTTIKNLYAPFVSNHDRFLLMDVKSSEMTKYVVNAMLTTKISFINEIVNICELTGANVKNVRLGIGSDKRKDTTSSMQAADMDNPTSLRIFKDLLIPPSHGYNLLLLSNVEEVNKNQKNGNGE